MRQSKEKFPPEPLKRPEIKTFFNIYETMYESVRLTTFSNWKSEYLTQEDASRDGRVECWTGKKTKLQCVFCGHYKTLDLKNPNMKNLLKKSHSIYCPLLCSHPTGNVPLYTNNLDEAEVYKFLEKYLEERKSNKHICMGYTPGYGDSDRDFEEPYKRQETFVNWPFNFFAENYIEAGFIYTGLSDFVVCHKCQGGLYNFSAESDPWKEHENHYSTCPYITGEDESDKESTEKSFRTLTDSEIDLLLKHPIAISMRELLEDAVKIKKTLSSFLTKYGVMPITTGQAIAFMQLKKDQYDADYRNIMKFGSHRTSFISFDEINDYVIDISELLEQNQIENKNLTSDISSIKSDIDENNCKIENIETLITSEFDLDSAFLGLTSTKSHSAEYFGINELTGDFETKSQMGKTVSDYNLNQFLIPPVEDLDSVDLNQFLIPPLEDLDSVEDLDYAENSLLTCPPVEDLDYVENSLLTCPPVEDLDYAKNSLLTSPPVEDLDYAENSLLTCPPVEDLDYAKNSLLTCPPVEDLDYAKNSLFTSPPVEDLDYAENSLLTSPPVEDLDYAENSLLTCTVSLKPLQENSHLEKNSTNLGTNSKKLDFDLDAFDTDNLDIQSKLLQDTNETF